MDITLSKQVANNIMMIMVYILVISTKLANLYVIYMAINLLKDVIHPAIRLLAILDLYISNINKVGEFICYIYGNKFIKRCNSPSN